MELKVGDIVKYSGEVLLTVHIWKELYKLLSIEKEYEIKEIIKVNDNDCLYCKLIDNGYYYPSIVLYKSFNKQYIIKEYGFK